MSRQKELDVVPKAIQNREFLGQLEKLNNDNNNVESYLYFNDFRKT